MVIFHSYATNYQRVSTQISRSRSAPFKAPFHSALSRVAAALRPGQLETSYNPHGKLEAH